MRGCGDGWRGDGWRGDGWHGADVGCTGTWKPDRGVVRGMSLRGVWAGWPDGWTRDLCEGCARRLHAVARMCASAA